MCQKTLSVFFPCYNEELNLKGIVTETTHVLKSLVQEYEILIVNDGSIDGTGPLAEKISRHYKNVRVIHHDKNLGYGAALITGFSNAIYDWVFYTDGDHQFYISEIDFFLKETDCYDLIIGFRKERQDPSYRLLYARAWNLLVRLFFGLKVRDINCAFKLIRKNILDNMYLNASGAMINTELLWKSKLSDCRIKELGVSHRARVYGTQTGGNPKVVLKAFIELFALWFKKSRNPIF